MTLEHLVTESRVATREICQKDRVEKVKGSDWPKSNNLGIKKMMNCIESKTVHIKHIKPMSLKYSKNPPPLVILKVANITHYFLKLVNNYMSILSFPYERYFRINCW